MKIRNGFVSNSSSSSFVITAKDKDHTKISVTFEVDLSNFTSSYYKGNKIASTVKDLEDIFEYSFDFKDGQEDGSFWQEKFNKAKAAIQQGKIVICGRFSDEDCDPISSFLCKNGIKSDKKNGIEVIHSEGGY